MKIRTLYITISNTSTYSKTIPKLKHFLVRYITGAKKTCLFFLSQKARNLVLLSQAGFSERGKDTSQ